MADRPTPGVLVSDRSRSIVVVSDDGELAVAVGDAVDRAMAVVRDSRPDDTAAVSAACRPWPWMIIGAGPALPPGLAALFRSSPVLVLWLGGLPAEMPAHARGFSSPAGVLDAVRECLGRRIGGMRLAPGTGVELDGGQLVRIAALEALIGAYPGGLAVTLRSLRAASRALSRIQPGWGVRRLTGDRVGLTPLMVTAPGP